MCGELAEMASTSQTVGKQPLNLRAIGHAIDQMPITRRLLTVIVVAALASLFDNMDSKLLGFALPGIAKEFGLKPQVMGLIASSTMIGMMVGSFVWIADKWGRRLAFMATVLIFSLFSGFTAAAFSVGFLLSIRFVTGFGLGGAIPVDASILAEFSPARIRGYAGGILPLAFPVGTFLASWVALMIVPHFGWRMLFLVGVIPALLVVWMRRNVPESPRWLANRGRFAESCKGLNYLGISDEAIEQSRIATMNEPPAPVLPKPIFWDLFTPEMRSRTAHTWIVWGLPAMASWGMTLWMPQFFIKLYGLNIKTAISYTLYISLVAIAGRLSAYLFLDRIGRKPFTILGYAMAGAFLLLVTQVHTGINFAYCLAGYMYFIEMGMCAITPYTPEVYPLHIRVMGTSTAMGVGRIGGAAGPYLIGILMGSGHVEWIWIVLGGALIVAAAATVWIGIETRGRNLEQLTRAATEGAANRAS
jgi:putative MFS transporter